MYILHTYWVFALHMIDNKQQLVL